MNKDECNLGYHASRRWIYLVLLLVAVTMQAAPSISNEEQQILQKAGINMSDYDNWRFEVSDGHIRKVSLYDCGLTHLPLALIELPYVEVVDLNDNAITGDLGQMVQAYIDSSPTVSQHLISLNLNGNELSGDVGPLVELLNAAPKIEALYVERNHLTDISTVPQAEDFMVYLYSQHIDLQVDFAPDSQTPADLMALLPPTALYDRWGRDFSEYQTVECFDQDTNVFDIYADGDRFSVWTASELRMKNGSVYDALCGNVYFRIRVLFTMGDVNFSGTIDEDDLSNTIDYIKDDNEWSFNYTAADVNNDGTVDMLDYVTLQHSVFGTTPETTQAGTNTITIPDLLFNSETKLLPISIDNANDIVALQFDLVLPEDTWGYLWDENIAERVVGYEYNTYAHVGSEEGKIILRYVIYSPSGASLLEGHSGEAFSLRLNRDMQRDYPSMQMEVRNVVMATTDGRNVFTSATLGWMTFDTTVDSSEWAALQRANPQRMDSNGQTVPLWDFSGGPATAKNLTGVTIENGHITKIIITNQRLTGPFPFALTELPYLQELRVYGNPLLTGDIGEQTEAFKAGSPTVSTVLTKIDFDDCGFYGNIGPLLGFYPVLEDVWAQGNRLTDITPLPSSAINLRIGGQRLDNVVVTCNSATMTTETFLEQLPDVVRLDGTKITDELHVICYRDGKNVFDVRTTWDKKFEFWTDGSFYQNGETFRAEGGNGKYNLRFFWTMGDANFDGTIDVADVQRLAHCVGFNTFSGWSHCNASACDLNGDSLLNVLDVVSLVDMVMAQQPQAIAAHSKAADAWLSCADGQLTIHAAEPVGAFDILVGNTEAIELSQQMQTLGMTVAIERQGSSLHLVGYSTGQANLPAGQTVIGLLHGNAPRLTGAVVTDNEQQRMSVAYDTTTGLATPTTTEVPKRYVLHMGKGQGLRIDEKRQKKLYHNK